MSQKPRIDSSRSIESAFRIVRADGVEKILTIRIGLPVKRGDAWGCPFEFSGDRDLPDAPGSNAMQAMCLALRSARSTLCTIIARGHRVYLEGDSSDDSSDALTIADVNTLFGIASE